MASSLEEKFRNWMGAASDTEKDKREHAERQIRDAIRNDETLSKHDVKVFAQGSYRNNTNIPQDSDVDVCVCCMDSFFLDLTFADEDLEPSDFADASYRYQDFKRDVYRALIAKFGSTGVIRGNKAFKIRENTYRVDADAVACFEHRRYHGRARDRDSYYISGTQFIAEDDSSVVNWPNQHYENGVSKNEATGRRFKGVTRIVKHLRYEMQDAGVQSARPIPSFLIECLVWNAPDDGFGHRLVTDDVHTVLSYTRDATSTDQGCWDWGEVNELKYLFRPSQPWTRQQANAFLNASLRHLGFE